MSNYLNNSISDYNPFEESKPAVPTTTRVVPRPVFTPAVEVVTSRSNLNENTPILSEPKPKEQIINPLLERADELNRREAELMKREKEISQSEQQSTGDHMKNFPPFPKWFCFRPCFYQDFDVEINSKFRGTVRFGFWIWMMYSLVLFINIFGALSYMIVSNATSESSSTFGLSLLLFFLLSPLSYVLWFRPLYKCFRSQSSLNFFIFIVFFAVYLVLTIIQCLGINWLGSCGWINSSIVLKSNFGSGIFMIFIAVTFTVLLAASMFLIFKVNRLYRTSEVSMDKAKAEFAQKSTSNIFAP